MKYTKLGSTGLDISRLCLGCMTYGDPHAGNHSWTLPLEQSRPIVKHAVEQGITFFDTANSYSAGTSETIMGQLLKEFTRREEVVVATKVYFPYVEPDGTRHRQGLSRKSVMAEVDASLARLGMDYVDLLQIHRWDYETPIEETMSALNDIVRAGKARYIGASSMHAWQFAKAQDVARRHGWTEFVSMQNHLNLLYREEEREMIPLCADQGIGLLPWSPLARGRLTRPPGVSTARLESDQVGIGLYAKTAEADLDVIQAVQQLAAERDVKMAQVALAWVLQKAQVSAPIIGASTAGHIDDAVAALDLTLAEHEVQALEVRYVPHAISGHQ